MLWLWHTFQPRLKFSNFNPSERKKYGTLWLYGILWLYGTVCLYDTVCFIWYIMVIGILRLYIKCATLVHDDAMIYFSTSCCKILKFDPSQSNIVKSRKCI